MSKTVDIKSAEQFNALLKSSRVVVADCEFTLHPPSIMDGIGYTPPSSRRPSPPAACRGLPSMRRDDGPTRFQSFFLSFLFAYHIFTSCKQPLTGFFIVYADWCQPCKQIAPFFAKLSQSLSRPNIATFVKIDVEAEGCKPVAAEYAVSALPTFIIFHKGVVVEKVKGANTVELQQAVDSLTANIENAGESGSSSGGIAWKGADLPKGYTDITDTVDVRGLELLNADSNFSVRTLFSKDKPSALEKGKSTSTEKDWVESDTDEQLLLYTPFNSSVKIHTLQVRCIHDSSHAYLTLTLGLLDYLPTTLR